MVFCYFMFKVKLFFISIWNLTIIISSINFLYSSPCNPPFYLNYISEEFLMFNRTIPLLLEKLQNGSWWLNDRNSSGKVHYFWHQNEPKKETKQSPPQTNDSNFSYELWTVKTNPGSGREILIKFFNNVHK